MSGGGGEEGDAGATDAAPGISKSAKRSNTVKEPSSPGNARRGLLAILRSRHLPLNKASTKEVQYEWTIAMWMNGLSMRGADTHTPARPRLKTGVPSRGKVGRAAAAQRDAACIVERCCTTTAVTVVRPFPAGNPPCEGEQDQRPSYPSKPVEPAFACAYPALACPLGASVRLTLVTSTVDAVTMQEDSRRPTP